MHALQMLVNDVSPFTTYISTPLNVVPVGGLFGIMMTEFL